MLLIKVLLLFCYCVSSKSVLISLAPLSLGKYIKIANINSGKRKRYSDLEKESNSTRSKLVCKESGKIGITPSSLMIHKRSDNGEEVYPSDVCDKEFASHSHCIRHKKNHFLEHPHVCDVCQKTFSRADILKEHKIIHNSEDNSYECEVCHKRFTQMRHLIQHKKTYNTKNNLSGKKIYKCAFCHKSFEYSVFLTWHQEKTLQKNGFQCFVCNEFFTKGSFLYLHRQKGCQKKETLFFCMKKRCARKPFSTPLEHYLHDCIVHTNRETTITDLKNNFYEFIKNLIEDKILFFNKDSLEIFFRDYDKRREKLFRSKLKKEDNDLEFLLLGDILSLFLDVRWSIRNRIEKQNRGVEKLLPEKYYLLIYDPYFLEDIDNERLTHSEFALFFTIFLNMFYESAVPVKVMCILNKHMPSRSA